MLNPVQIIARLACIATSLAAADKPFLRIISPVNGAVVRPGQKLLVKVTGAGDYPGIGVLGEEVAGAIQAPMGKPPWIVSVMIPSEPGKTSLTATSTTLSGTEVESNTVEIDVEPVEIPPASSLQSDPSMSLGGCLTITNESRCSGLLLMIYGTYPDGTIVSLNRSTRLKPVSQSPSIVAVSKDGSTLLGVSKGTAKIVVFGKDAIDIKVY